MYMSAAQLLRHGSYVMSFAAVPSSSTTFALGYTPTSQDLPILGAMAFKLTTSGEEPIWYFKVHFQSGWQWHTLMEPRDRHEPHDASDGISQQDTQLYNVRAKECSDMKETEAFLKPKVQNPETMSFSTIGMV
ncbi:hypothetical protein HBI51_019430 [Parastagonospora nodorum]|nr:hypothetical protein HBI51_019430 [Parastagonospora nodorum]KAH6221973.1 hypothetical protein HBI43_094500 [Parastagonospora nodorum]